MLVVGGLLAVCLAPVQIRLGEVVEGHEFRRDGLAVSHQLVELLVGSFPVFSEGNLSTADGTVPALGLLTDKRLLLAWHDLLAIRALKRAFDVSMVRSKMQKGKKIRSGG